MNRKLYGFLETMESAYRLAGAAAAFRVLDQLVCDGSVDMKAADELERAMRESIKSVPQKEPRIRDHYTPITPGKYDMWPQPYTHITHIIPSADDGSSQYPNMSSGYGGATSAPNTSYYDKFSTDYLNAIYGICGPEGMPK